MDVNHWYRNRRYLHFDVPVGIKKASKIVLNPISVQTHSFFPFLSYQISSRKIFKNNGTIKYKDKNRPIAFASHVDSHIYAYYSQLLSNAYEKNIVHEELDEVVLAFRKLGKSNIDFAYDAFENIKSRGECSALAFDITGFFDNLDHDVLKDNWCTLIGLKKLPADHFAVFKSITKFSQVDRSDLYRELGFSTNNPPKDRRRICDPKDFRSIVRAKGLIKTNIKSKGIPQGSPISAFLSNLYMFDFDKKITAAVEEQGGTYVRYCDDMLFIVPSQWRNSVAELVRKEINKLKIDINPRKTEIRDFRIEKGKLKADKPLQYLGFLFDGNQITLRSASLARYSERMRRGVALAKKTKIKFNRLRTKNGKSTSKLYRQKLYSTYSHLGKRNFVRYGYRAAEKMSSRAIKRQLKPLWKRLVQEIHK